MTGGSIATEHQLQRVVPDHVSDCAVFVVILRRYPDRLGHGDLDMINMLVVP